MRIERPDPETLFLVRAALRAAALRDGASLDPAIEALGDHTESSLKLMLPLLAGAMREFFEFRRPLESDLSLLTADLVEIQTLWRGHSDSPADIEATLRFACGFPLAQDIQLPVALRVVPPILGMVLASIRPTWSEGFDAVMTPLLAQPAPG